MRKYAVRRKIGMGGLAASLALALTAQAPDASAQSPQSMLNYHSNLNGLLLNCAYSGSCDELNRHTQGGMRTERGLSGWVFGQQQSNSMRTQQLSRQYHAEGLGLQRRGDQYDTAAKRAYEAGNPYLAYRLRSQAQQYYNQARSYRR